MGPFFKAGLENNEKCIWVLSEGLTIKEAGEMLEKETGNVKKYTGNGQLEIIDSGTVYERPGGFVPYDTMKFYKEETDAAIKRGFSGIRVSGSGNFVKPGQWPLLCDYERDVSDIINNGNIIAMCTYSRDIAGVPEILKLGSYHDAVILRKNNEYGAIMPTSFPALYDIVTDSE